MSYIDLKLTNSGDIDIEFDRVLSSCNIMFNISKYDGQLISFMTQRQNNNASGQQNISFSYIKSDTYAINNNSVYDLEEQLQAVMLMLKTELNDTDIEGFGSLLYQYRHNVITTNSTIEKITNVATAVVNSIIEDATVEVNPMVTGDGYFYCQTVEIRIFIDGECVATHTF